MIYSISPPKIVSLVDDTIFKLGDIKENVDGIEEWDKVSSNTLGNIVCMRLILVDNRNRTMRLF